MAKTITITFEGEEYILEFSRKSVSEMEREGFRISDLRDKPLNAYPVLFQGAFKCHHKRIKPDVTNRIYSKIPQKDEFIDKLAEMYADTVNTLFDEPEEDEKNVAGWKASF